VRIGACAIPTAALAERLRWIAREGFDFVEIGWDSVQQYPDRGSDDVVRALEGFDAPPIGHTTAYLPSAFPVEAVRAAACVELQRQCAILAGLGAEKIVVHPSAAVPPYIGEGAVARAFSKTLSELTKAAQNLCVSLLVENMCDPVFGSPGEIGSILGEHPETGFVLDLGHAREEAGTGAIESFLAILGSRLTHVHAHDIGENGGDAHLGIGDGVIDWEAAVAALKGSGFDGTVTIEVFEGGNDAVLMSRDRFRQIWETAGSPMKGKLGLK
jgi:sugar phosphate isomerase/epimerase